MSDSTLREIVEFLDGSAPLEGVWFGEPHPTERGAFWWRSRLTAALAADDAARGTMREQFEAFAIAHGLDVTRTASDDYLFGGANWAWEVWQASRAAAPSRDAYEGCREDLLDWKRRALEAEETCRQLTRALAEEVNGPTFMGEPVLVAAPQSVEPLFLLHCGALFGSERDDWEVEAYSGKAVDAFADAHAGQTIGLYAAPPTAPTDAEWQELHDALANSRRRYGEVGTRDVDIADWNARVDRALAAFRAHIANRPQGDEWMPIETAPRDGTIFLGWVAAERGSGLDGECSSHAADTSQVDFCWWRNAPDAPAPEARTGGYFDNASGQIGDGQDITHWRPLPAPPTKTKEQP